MVALPIGRISGRTLDTIVTAMLKTPAKHPIARIFRAQLGIEALAALSRDTRAELPFSLAPIRARTDHSRPSLGLDLPNSPNFPRSLRAIAEAYRQGSASPITVIERALGAARKLAQRTPSVGPFCDYDDARALAAAQESSERLARGQARSVFEGIPIGIKEETDCQSFATRLGTRFLPHTKAAEDAAAVARLRSAGAIIVGQTPMTEYGLSPLGANPHRRMPRNPHDPTRLAGGSSTGSAVAVATGITPVSLGADGGGSIRIPAALCGVFGLKPTYGRIPINGGALPGSTSVVHLGPIGTGSYELASFVEITNGPDSEDPASQIAPPLNPEALINALGRGVKNLHIGVDEHEWASVSDEIAGPGRQALDALEREGAKLVPIRLNLGRHAAAIGYLTIVLELYAELADVRRSHIHELAPDVQLMLAGLDAFRPDDYIDAQRLRSALRKETAAALREVDVIALPTTARTAPSVTEEEATTGFVDSAALNAVCRFSFLANLTGLPAATAPVGRDRNLLPVGLQIIGDAWDEACVLQVIAHLERLGAASITKPEVYVDLLAG